MSGESLARGGGMALQVSLPRHGWLRPRPPARRSPFAMSIVQLANVVLSITGILIWLTWMRGNGHIRLYGVAPISWLLHNLIFYAALGVFDNPIQPSPGFGIWASATRLHGLILIVSFAFVLSDFRKRSDGWRT